MSIFSWGILLVILAILGFVITRMGEPEEQTDTVPLTAAERIQEAATRLTERVRSSFQEVSGNILPQNKQDAVEKFRAWAEQDPAGNADINAWFQLLSDEQIGLFMTHLADFCDELGFDLNWLLDGQIEQNPELAQHLRDVVFLYSRASYRTMKVYEDVKIFEVYHDYLQNPKSRQNHALGEILFGRLIERGLTSIKVSEHLEASMKKRQEQIVQAIQKAAIEQPQAFNQLLKEVLEEAQAVMAVEDEDSPIRYTNGTAPSSKVEAVG